MSKAPALIWLLTGNDSYSRQEQLQHLLTQYVDPDWRDFTLERLDGDLVNAGTVVDAWLTPPFYGDRRVVVVEYVRTADGLSDVMQQVNQTLQQSTHPPANILILVADSLDRRRKETKAFLQWATHKEYLQTKSWNVEKELFPWIEEVLRQQKRRISRPAMERLVLAAGIDKNVLKQALDKLLVYLDERTLIEEKDVLLLIQPTEADVFGMLESLAKQQYGDAVNHLQQLLLREPAQKVIATLATVLRQLWRSKALLAQKHSVQDIATLLNQNLYVLKKNLALWEHYSAPVLEKRLQRLMEFDAQSKSTSLNAQLALELWLREFVLP